MNVWDEGRDEAVYRGDSLNSVSNTERECFRRCPEMYYDRYISGTAEPERTAALEIGGGLHQRVLLPGDDSIVVIPEALLKSNGARNPSNAEYKEFVASTLEDRPHARLLTPPEVQCVQAMRDAILRSPTASQFLSGLAAHAREVPLKTYDAESGLWLRCRLDALSETDAGTPVIVDIKTTAADVGDLQAVAGHAERFGYHRQGAFYKRVAEAALDAENLPFLFVFVEKKQPFRVRCLELDGDWLKEAEEENAETLAAMAIAQATGVYQTPGINEVACLSRPRFARYRKEYELEV